MAVVVAEKGEKGGSGPGATAAISSLSLSVGRKPKNRLGGGGEREVFLFISHGQGKREEEGGTALNWRWGREGGKSRD